VKRSTKIALAGVGVLVIGVSVVGWTVYRGFKLGYEDERSAMFLRDYCPKILELIGPPAAPKFGASCKTREANDSCVVLEGQKGTGEYHWLTGQRNGEHDIVSAWFTAGNERVDVIACMTEYVNAQQAQYNEAHPTKNATPTPTVADCEAGKAFACMTEGVGAAAMKDFDLARKLIQRACDLGSADDCDSGAALYEKGELVPGDASLARALRAQAKKIRSQKR
jgi:hypothetical protein